MNYNIEVTPVFKRRAKILSKHYPSFKMDIRDFLVKLRDNPKLGVDLGNGIRKIRMSITSKNKGKSAGARVITYTAVVAMTESVVYLVSVYDKSDQETLSIHQINLLLKECGFIL